MTPNLPIGFQGPPVKQEHGRLRAQHHGQMLTFHGELAFLIRTFFFVLLGALVEFEGLRNMHVLALEWFWSAFDRALAVRPIRPLLAWRASARLASANS